MEVYEIEETVYLLLFITDDILLKQWHNSFYISK